MCRGGLRAPNAILTDEMESITAGNSGAAFLQVRPFPAAPRVRVWLARCFPGGQNSDGVVLRAHTHPDAPSASGRRPLGRCPASLAGRNFLSAPLLLTPGGAQPEPPPAYPAATSSFSQQPAGNLPGLEPPSSPPGQFQGQPNHFRLLAPPLPVEAPVHFCSLPPALAGPCLPPIPLSPGRGHRAGCREWLSQMMHWGPKQLPSLPLATPKPPSPPHVQGAHPRAACSRRRDG